MSYRKFRSLFDNYVTMQSPLGVTYCVGIPIHPICPACLSHIEDTKHLLHSIHLLSEFGTWLPSMGGFSKPLLRHYSTPSVMSCISGTCDAGLPSLKLLYSFGVYGKVAIRSSSRMLCQIHVHPYSS